MLVYQRVVLKVYDYPGILSLEMDVPFYLSWLIGIYLKKDIVDGHE